MRNVLWGILFVASLAVATGCSYKSSGNITPWGFYEAHIAADVKVDKEDRSVTIGANSGISLEVDLDGAGSSDPDADGDSD